MSDSKCCQIWCHQKTLEDENMFDIAGTCENWSCKYLLSKDWNNSFMNVPTHYASLQFILQGKKATSNSSSGVHPLNAFSL